MKIEVAEFNDDGSIRATHVYSPEEAQRLLEFAVNFMMGIGNTAIIMQDNQPEEFDD